MDMRWLKNLISLALVLVAAGLALSIGLSDHSDDYGQVGLPQGGVVHLPDGRVTVYYSQVGDNSDPLKQNSVPLGFQVVSPRGVPVPIATENGAPAASSVTRSETVGELGAVAKLDVPSSGDYIVQGSTNLPAGTSFLKFGTNAGAALLARWHLLAALLIAAFLIAIIPTPRPRRRWEDEGDAPTGWSSDPRAPYAG
jgi:hypothetical protein